MNKLLFLLSALSVFMAKGQTATLSKEEAVRLTLESNLLIKLEYNLEKIAKNNSGLLNSGYLPSVTGNAGANYNKTDSESVFRDGNQVSLSGVETSRYNADVTLNYVLFDGLGRLYNYRRLQEQHQLTALQTRETIENTVLQLFTVYYEVARLTENLSTLNQTLKISKDRKKRALLRFEYGQGTRLDLLNAQVDVNTDSINILNAGQLLQNTQRDLNLILNRELDTPFAIDTTVAFTKGLFRNDVLERADKQNVRLLQLNKGLAVNQLAYKTSRSNFLPRINLSGSYGWNKNNNAPISFITSSTSTGITLGAGLSWNLFDGGSTITAVRNAKLTLENEKLLQEQGKKEVDRDVKNAWNTYQNSLFVLEAQQQNVNTTQNNFERSNEQYKNGQLTSLAFRQAQINFLNAVLAKNEARYTAKLAELRILQLSGDLLNTPF